MIYYFIGTVIWGIVWGVACNKVIENKGYDENWFWWGFFFSFIAFIVALTKPDNHHYYEQADQYGNVKTDSNSALALAAREKSIEQIMRAGGWKCNNCGRTNTSATGTCACGWTKEQSYENKIEEDKRSEQSSTTTLVTENANLEILKKYKELLDMGAINQEEFDKKKNEILGAGNTDITDVVETAEKEIQKEEKLPPTSWTCYNCGKENDLDRKSCKVCGAIKEAVPVYGKVNRLQKRDSNLADWKCPKCGAVNKCYIGLCKCGTYKSEGTIIEN